MMQTDDGEGSSALLNVAQQSRRSSIPVTTPVHLPCPRPSPLGTATSPAHLHHNSRSYICRSTPIELTFRYDSLSIIKARAYASMESSADINSGWPRCSASRRPKSGELRHSGVYCTKIQAAGMVPHTHHFVTARTRRH